jgi:hypothetical protein
VKQGKTTDMNTVTMRWMAGVGVRCAMEDGGMVGHRVSFAVTVIELISCFLYN